jgi:hypothetical protein
VIGACVLLDFSLASEGLVIDAEGHGVLAVADDP